MTPELSVKISADIDLLRDNFRKAIVNVKNFDKDTKVALSSVDKGFERLANDIDKDMSRTSASVNKASSNITRSLAQQAVATSKSRNTYLEFGRVLQDLPYGFTGIQNNLTQLVPAAGAAGLAFSALISLLTFATVGTDNWTRGLKGNKTALDAVALSGDEYIETLSQINAVRLKGEQNTTKEIAELKVLYGAYTNANLPLKVRQEAYKDLQKEYPAYFKNIQFEQEASLKTTTAYNSLTQAILATGRARAAVDKIAENESRKLENEQKLIDLEKERLKLLQQRNKLQSRAISDLTTSTREGAGIADITRTDALQGKINDNIEKQNNLKTDSKILDENNLRLVQAVNVELTKGAEILGKVGEIEKEIAKVKNSNKLGKVDSVNVAGDPVLLNQYKDFNDAAVNFSKARKLNEGFLPGYIKLIQEAAAANDKFVESLNSVATSALSSGIGDAFASIGMALADGTNAIEAFGTALLDAFAGFLSQLGQMFIKEGIAQIGYGIAKNLILPGSGINNISGGTAMIAAGAGISVLGGALRGGKGGGSQNRQATPIKGFASGVNNFSGGMALVGERGAELVNLPTGASVMNNNRTNQILKDNNRNEQVQVFGEVGFDMDKFVIKFRNTENRLKRQGAFS